MAAGALMRFRLAEPSVAALCEHLRARLPDAVAQVNAEVTDDLYVSEPAVLDYPLPLELQTAWPLVCVTRERGLFTDDTGWTTGAQWTLALWVFVQDPDPQGLARRLERTLAATTTAALGAQRSFNGQAGEAYGITPREVRYGPVLGDLPDGAGTPPHGLLSYAALTLDCLSDEQ